ncbi:MAG: DUF444 family protein, partial [Desulfobacterales bacterium]|nr:DUF444 family protein [Desulfobacterales bacterium]
MKEKLLKLYEGLKERGLTPDRERMMKAEIRSAGSHAPPAPSGGEDETLAGIAPTQFRGLYTSDDPTILQGLGHPPPSYTMALQSVDELLARDKQREKDGFPRKIRVGRLAKPGKGGKDKIVVVPTTVEEKFYHDSITPPDEEESSGGSGEGEEGEVIGEQQAQEQEAAGSGPGEGEGAGHEIESNAYDLGRILTEKFELPNLEDKGKKRSLTRYTYDLTDRHRGFGQILDKKATMRQIVQTNVGLGNLPDVDDIDLTRFLVAPSDMVYRILSREKDYESQAMVFFLR